MPIQNLIAEIGEPESFKSNPYLSLSGIGT